MSALLSDQLQALLSSPRGKRRAWGYLPLILRSPLIDDPEARRAADLPAPPARPCRSKNCTAPRSIATVSTAGAIARATRTISRWSSSVRWGVGPKRRTLAASVTPVAGTRAERAGAGCCRSGSPVSSPGVPRETPLAVSRGRQQRRPASSRSSHRGGSHQRRSVDRRVPVAVERGKCGPSRHGVRSTRMRSSRTVRRAVGRCGRSPMSRSCAARQAPRLASATVRRCTGEGGALPGSTHGPLPRCRRWWLWTRPVRRVRQFGQRYEPASD